VVAESVLERWTRQLAKRLRDLKFMLQADTESSRGRDLDPWSYAFIKKIQKGTKLEPVVLYGYSECDFVRHDPAQDRLLNFLRESEPPPRFATTRARVSSSEPPGLE
jgi:hypothetical protein